MALHRKRLRCTFEKACFVKWLVRKAGLTMSQAAVIAELNVGTVSHVIRGHRFGPSFPVKPPGF